MSIARRSSRSGGRFPLSARAVPDCPGSVSPTQPARRDGHPTRHPRPADVLAPVARRAFLDTLRSSFRSPGPTRSALGLTPTGSASPREHGDIPAASGVDHRWLRPSVTRTSSVSRVACAARSGVRPRAERIEPGDRDEDLSVSAKARRATGARTSAGRGCGVGRPTQASRPCRGDGTGVDPELLEPTKGIARQSASSDGRLTLLGTKGNTGRSSSAGSLPTWSRPGWCAGSPVASLRALLAKNNKKKS